MDVGLSAALLISIASAPPSVSSGYDASLSGYAYPFETKRFAIASEAEPLEMAYLDVAAERPNGRTIVLLHGKNFSAAYWAPTIRALAKAGFRVIAPDQIGFGRSSKPERFQFSFHALARHTRSLLASLGIDRSAIVGHSMGGMLAVRYALMFPEQTERLILVNPIGLEDYASVVPYRTVGELQRAEMESTPEKVISYFRDNYFGGVWKNEYAALVEIQIGWMRGPDRARMADISARTTDMIFTQPVIQELPEIRVPTLLIIGQRDRTAIGKDRVPETIRASLGEYPQLGRRARAAIPDARLVEIEAAGHLPQVEKFEEYLRALLEFVPTK